MDPESYKGALVSITTKDGSIFQGHILEIKPGADPFLVLKKPFKDGVPTKQATLLLKHNEMVNVKIIEDAPTETLPEKAEKAKKNQKKKEKKPVEVKPKDPPPVEEKKVTVLKRGQANQLDYGLSNDLSNTHIVAEPKPAGKENKIDIGLIPAAVLKGKRSSKAVIDKLLAAPSSSSVKLPPSVEEKKTPAASALSGGIRIDVQQLLASSVSTCASSPEKKPAFKKYGDFKQFTQKQEPDYQSPSEISRNRKNGRGPSGNPTQDVQNGYKLRNKNLYLAKTLNLDELSEDFDFSATLEMEQASREDSQTQQPKQYDDELPAEQRNFRHDENIINDPARCTSWVKSSDGASGPSGDAKAQPLFKNRFQEKSSVVSQNGGCLPVLCKKDKERYNEAAIRLFNPVFYNLMAGERFTAYAMEVQQKHVRMRQVVVVAGHDIDHVLLHRVCQHLVNRLVDVTVYCPPVIPGTLLDQVNVVSSAQDLPNHPQYVYLLNSRVFYDDEHFRRWVGRVGKPATGEQGRQRRNSGPSYAIIIGLEFRVFDVQCMHSLYLGVCDEIAVSVRKNSNSTLSKPLYECAVADIGIPTEWIEGSEDKQALAFRDSFFSRVALR